METKKSNRLAAALVTACVGIAAFTFDGVAGLPGASMADVASQMPLLAPRALIWAKDLESDALRDGSALGPRMRSLARSVGVRDTQRIRVMVVDRIPLPDEPLLQSAALRVGLSSTWASGMTLGYAVIIRRGYEHDLRNLSHEFRHVAQYEAAGGVEGFLAKHLVDLAMYGYEDSPYERDARAHERNSFPRPPSK